MTLRTRFDLDPKDCIFCGACASVAPDHFVVEPDKRIVRVERQPETEEEVTVCRAAMFNCPSSAIRETETT